MFSESSFIVIDHQYDPHHHHLFHHPPHQLVWACFVETTHAGQGCPHLVPRACLDELLYHTDYAEDEDGFDDDIDDNYDEHGDADDEYDAPT